MSREKCGLGSVFRLFGCSVVLLSACAKVGDPLPPLDRPLPAAQDLTLVQIADRVRLLFSPPPPEVRFVEIYFRRGAPVVRDGERTLVDKLERTKFQTQDGKWVFESSHPGWNQVWYYALRFVAEGRPSTLSSSVSTAPVPPALPPHQLTREVQEDRIIVRWEPPEANVDGSRPAHIEGYLVNAEHFVVNPQFEDQDFKFGQEKTYRIQTATRRADPLVLSDFSSALPVIPKDSFPPAAPQNVSALAREGKIQILWNPGQELDLHGYFLYRGTRPDQLEKSSGLITMNSYIDENVKAGATYYYRVAAVDESGNESGKSAMVVITLGG